MVGAGGFSCRLVKVSYDAGSIRDSTGRIILRQELRGYGSWYQDGGRCIDGRAGSAARSGPIDAAGQSLAGTATFVGILWTSLVLLRTCFPAAIQSSARCVPSSVGIAVTAFVLAIVATSVAFLGLAVDECRAAEGGSQPSCQPAVMAYVVVGGAVCWVCAGSMLCRRAAMERREEARWAYRGVPATELAEFFGQEAPIAVSTVATTLATLA